MELIRTLKEKSQTRREQAIQQQAEEIITLSDFDDHLYIAYSNTPLFPIDPSWTSVQILSTLKDFRQNYVNSKMKSIGLNVSTL